MSSLQIHPEDGLLLRYIDGELPARKIRQVGRHLEACWQCRTEVEGLQDTVADCIRYRKTVLQTHLPQPPNPWKDLYGEFARVDAELLQASWTERLKQTLAGPGTRRWGVAMAAAAVIAFGIFEKLHETPTVEAAVLLKRAVSAAVARPSVPRRVLVQTRTQRMIRTIDAQRPAAIRESLAATLQERFQAAHYDWDDPLSAKAYQGWFDGLTSKQGEVTTIADPQLPAESRYQIRTVTSQGELAAVSLTLRTNDLRPVESKLEFRDHEWVEFTEIAEAAPDGIITPSTSVGPSAGRPLTSRLAPDSSGPEATISDELQVLAALHEIGADLGDPVEVALNGGKVVVSGVGIPEQRQKRIHDALDAMPQVAIQFSEPAASALSAESTLAENGTGSAPKPAAIQSRVEQLVGGRAEFERFSAQILDRSEAMMARAYALRSLAQRYPAEKDANLSAQDREVLRGMARDNASALAKEVGALDRALTPILTAMGGSSVARPAASQSTWEPAAEELSRASHRMEVLVSVMLGTTRGSTSPDRVPSELLSAIREVRADLDQCQMLLK